MSLIASLGCIKGFEKERNFVYFVTYLAGCRSTLSMTFGWLHFYKRIKSQYLTQNSSPFTNPWDCVPSVQILKFSIPILEDTYIRLLKYFSLQLSQCSATSTSAELRWPDNGARCRGPGCSSS